MREQLIPYYQLPGGQAYYPAFLREAIMPLVRTFGDYPEKLFDVAKQLGGCKFPMGDAGVVIHALPLIPLYCSISKGDQDAPSKANILFDASAAFNLHTEDLAGLGQVLSYRLCRLAKEEQQ